MPDQPPLRLVDVVSLHRERTVFQLNVADVWLLRAKDAQSARAGLPEFQFMAQFAAFNALYSLCAELPALRKFSEGDLSLIKAALSALGTDIKSKILSLARGPPNEARQIDMIVSLLEPQAARDVFECSDTEHHVRYLVRRGPIQSMNSRATDGETGDSREGTKHLRRLEETTTSPVQRLQALAALMYIVRCNLVHGSKAVLGPDTELLEHCAPLQTALTAVVLTAVRTAAGHR